MVTEGAARVGGEGADLSISKESLKQLTDGLNAAIGELKSAGASATESVMGSGFEGMSLTNKEAGHGGLADDFEGFCENWEWGVRGLVFDANAIAAGLGLSAGMLYAEDQYWQGTFKYAANAANPGADPGLSQQEVAEQDWGEILTPDGPDWSAESQVKAGQEIRDSWANPEGTTKSMQPPAGGDG
ncbi:hypothetical protein DVA86_34305 [Streptomyces armeniacus]|uniref:Uncharacterized protein n=1 Tax=Streptomyces armeniacus TaxID=83291 RepID=A0A345XYZ2_9ACTN|nr:hypothetical protein DVA86_34305 [Streptomyces armeniacus]